MDVLRHYGDAPVRTGRPSTRLIVNELRRGADLIVVAEVVGVAPHLSKGRDWIDTELSLYVHEFIVKNQRLKDLSNNRKQQSNIPGGELFVGNTLEKTKGTFSWKIGSVYLLFLAKPPIDSPFLRWVYPPFVIEGTRLVRNSSDFFPFYYSRYYDPLGGQSLSTIVKLLKKPQP